MPEAGQGRRAGRPRNPSIDDRVLAATRACIVEAGWDGTSVRAVAARAKASRAAVLRRWPSKAHLVLDAVLGATPDLAPFEGVDAVGWIRWVAEGSVEIFARPEVRAAAPGLLAALRDQPDLREALWQAFTTEPVAIFAGLQSGDPQDAILEARALIVLAAGAALFASVLAGDDDTPALRSRVEEILLARHAAVSSTV
jgi:AcrR family transcriptional regulator